MGDPWSLDCIHRGSKRKSCCGMAELWICRHFRADCVMTPEAREKAIRDAGEAGKGQAMALHVCFSCGVRNSGDSSLEPHGCG